NNDQEEEAKTEVSVEAKPVAVANVGSLPGEDDEDDNENDDDDDVDDDELLEYTFDYGFNPLVFLGEYLRNNNPAAVQARKEQHENDLEYLRQRVAKCRERETAVVELRELVILRRSGITHGPIVGQVSDCGGIVWARTFRPGQLTIELSRHEDFRTICRQAVTKVDQSTECSAMVEFDSLDSSTTWYHRSYLHHPRKGFDGPAAGFCTQGMCFSTLPERDEDIGGLFVFRLVAFSLHGLGLTSAATKHRPEIEGTCSAISAAVPRCCLALGGPSTAQGIPATRSLRLLSPESFTDVQETAAKIPALLRLLQGNGFLTACGPIPRTKRHRGRHHHRNAKATKSGGGAHANGGATPAAGGAKARTKPKGSSPLAEGEDSGEGDIASWLPPDWPIRCPDAWGSHPLGPTAELFVTDARDGCVGEDQLAWVAEAVEESSRTWKVIACGVPVGFPVAPSVEQTQEDEGTAQQHAAAATIQARLRSHLISKSSTTTSNTAAATNGKKNKTAPAGGSGGGSLQQGESQLSASSRQEITHLSPATSGPSGGGGSDGDAVDGGVTAGQAWEEGSTDKTSSDVSKATVQLQSMVSRLHASGCSNVVFVTPARSRPHALSFFSGNETEGRFPVYELGCGGLAPLSDNGSGTSDSRDSNGDTETNTERPGPCPELAPQELMSNLEASLGDDGAGNGAGDEGLGGVACTLLFGQEEGEDHWLSFVVSNGEGEEIASITLHAAT
ncbi:unnamed protein product, partial [Ectocarpus sp. 12 AP-2014]